jgi:hypothetical protein
MKPFHAQRTPVFRAVGVLCVLLVLLVGFISAVHIHPASANAADSSCPACALAHAGVVLVDLGYATPVFNAAVLVADNPEAAPSYTPYSSLYIRPPPSV